MIVFVLAVYTHGGGQTSAYGGLVIRGRCDQTPKGVTLPCMGFRGRDGFLLVWT